MPETNKNQEEEIKFDKGRKELELVCLPLQRQLWNTLMILLNH